VILAAANLALSLAPEQRSVVETGSGCPVVWCGEQDGLLFLDRGDGEPNADFFQSPAIQGEA
jgi:hypothetical protein